MVENEAHFVLEWPRFNPIKDKFSSLFENVVLGSLKSFFQLDQQLDISLYLTETTTFCNSRKLTNLKQPDVLSIPLAFWLRRLWNLDILHSKYQNVL